MDSAAKNIFKKEYFSLWNNLWRQLPQFCYERSEEAVILKLISIVKSFINYSNEGNSVNASIVFLKM